jgi:SAM-dependent methyltransferase
MKRKLIFLFGLLGFNPLTTYNFIKGLRFYFRDLKTFKRQLKGNKEFSFVKYYPILGERFTNSGTLSGQYFYQDLLVAKRIFLNSPQRHADVASRIDGFVAHVASFREIEVFDIRPNKSKVSNIKFIQADLMQLPDNMTDYCDSISSLHAIEHFGLGRYGDPIDAYGHIKALENIYKILRKGGRFYFSVPMGPQRIEFNAHRVFDLSYLLKLFENKYQIERFSYVSDAGDLHEDIKLLKDKVVNNFGCVDGLGIFEFIKI